MKEMGARKGLRLVVCALVVKGRSFLLRTWRSLCFSLPNWSF